MFIEAKSERKKKKEMEFIYRGPTIRQVYLSTLHMLSFIFKIGS